MSEIGRDRATTLFAEAREDVKQAIRRLRSARDLAGDSHSLIVAIEPLLKALELLPVVR
jgi:hypothetical protein